MSLFHSDAFLAFRSRDFSLLSVNQLCLILAIMIQEVVIAYSIYQLTQNPLSLGMIALIELLPFICLSLISGDWADRYNRQKIVQWSFSCSTLIPLLFIVLFSQYQQQHIQQNTLLCGIYSLIFCLGVLRGIYSPSFNSLRPFLTPESAYSNAATWTALIWQMGGILAPLCAGLLLSQLGLEKTLFIVFLLCCMGSICLFGLSPRDFPSPHKQHLSKSLKEAYLFIFKHPLMFWSMLLDLSAMLFCSVIILLPIFAHEILHLGVEGLGILRAAPAIGACIMMLMLTCYSPMQNAWRNMLYSSFAIALCTLAFALSSHIWLSVFFLVLIGAFDSISMIIRQTLLQQIPPKALLGRVAALNGILVTSGNQLGALHMSLMTRYFSVVPAVLIGGTLCLIICGLSSTRTRHLFKPPPTQQKHTTVTRIE